MIVFKNNIEKKDVPKTRAEKKLSTKYKKLLESTDNYLALQQLAKDFKADLAVLLPQNRRYKGVK
jgi:hypothetical protein